MTPLSRYFPWAIAGLAATWMGIAMAPARDSADKMHLHEFGELPVVDGGRVKPIDTVARTNLMIISNKQSFRDDKGAEQPAIKWLLDVMTTQLPGKGTAELYGDMEITDPELLNLLGLKSRPDSRYSISEFAGKIPALLQRSNQAREAPPAQRGQTDRQAIRLAQQVAAYIALLRWENPKMAPGLPVDVLNLDLRARGIAEREKVFRIENDQVLNLLGLDQRPGSFRYSIAEFSNKFPQLDQQAKRISKSDPKQRDLFDQKIYELRRHLEMYLELAQWRTPLTTPPAVPNEEWQSFANLVSATQSADQLSPAANSFGSILRAYALDDPEMFNREVTAYREQLQQRMPDAMGRASFEVFFNHFEPYYQCSILYVLAFLLACFAWLGWTEPLNRASFLVIAVTLVVHTGALIARMYLMDRWWVFVTNLYSSAVFIGWGGVIMGLILEKIYRNGIGNIVASVMGFTTALIAHHLATDGDTLEMMRAVLDTNFWLATHVTCVTIGYASTFVAGVLAIIFVLLGVLTPALDRNLFRTLGQMIYGIICFATLFSFVGTVLGGIWADQSWGRFWGWDPKENGALIIVLWNALVLHARWGGMVKQRGMALLAIGGNIVTSWSWFGVNMLSVGLHSYGFMSGAQFWLVAFVLSQLGLIAVGSIPPRYWRSFAT